MVIVGQSRILGVVSFWRFLNTSPPILVGWVFARLFVVAMVFSLGMTLLNSCHTKTILPLNTRYEKKTQRI